MLGEGWEKRVNTQEYQWKKDVEALARESLRKERRENRITPRGRYAACPCQARRGRLPFAAK